MAFAAAGCASGGSPSVMQAASRGPTITFESIDGPPAPVFQRLVSNLSAAAESHRVLVVSRATPAAYRIRGYLAANVIQGRTHYDWVWDVYDADRHRTLRISGDETGGARSADAWAALDDTTVMRIAQTSMDRISAFLDQPAVATSTPSTAQAFADVTDTGTTLARPGPSQALR